MMAMPISVEKILGEWAWGVGGARDGQQELLLVGAAGECGEVAVEGHPRRRRARLAQRERHGENGIRAQLQRSGSATRQPSRTGKACGAPCGGSSGQAWLTWRCAHRGLWAERRAVVPFAADTPARAPPLSCTLRIVHKIVKFKTTVHSHAVGARARVKCLVSVVTPRDVCAVAARVWGLIATS